MLNKILWRSRATWKNIELGPSEPTSYILEAFSKDANHLKVNLAIDSYRDENLRPWILPSVRKAEELIINSDHDYTPIEGFPEFIKAATLLAYGPCSEISEGRVASIQALSGTGALRMGMAFLHQYFPHSKTVYFPKPTIENHKIIARDSGLEVKDYAYYDQNNKIIDISNLLFEIDAAPSNSIIIFHASAHNPTGTDPTKSQWEQIHEVVARKGHLPFFYIANQGFASGNPDDDVYPVRYFLQQNTQILLAQSFARNFGLYGDRVGLLSVICENKIECENVMSQLKVLERPFFGMPPKHGGEIVGTILNNAELYKQWRKDLLQMYTRITENRSKLVNKLIDRGSVHDWNHIRDQVGMYAYTGMSPHQCHALMNFKHIYLFYNGKMSLSGLNDQNLDYVAESIDEMTRYAPKYKYS
ncbi:unnamed protein product [Blepharisma stoltei]|uniref:Aminotransferase class I/classII large domain-containing protein n=1 Tax=Blepharisma stoltei TaxID=1481888 RepID=A0AAU9K9N1_9CILI|nr:unnamed protein product [Blepharisma stoltei]